MHLALRFFIKQFWHFVLHFYIKGGNCDPYTVNWCPPYLSFVRFITCCHCLCIRSSVPCHWNAGLLRLVGLKEYGLGTQSLGLNFPLSEVGTPLPHNLGMAYGPVTENNTHIFICKQQCTFCYAFITKNIVYYWYLTINTRKIRAIISKKNSSSLLRIGTIPTINKWFLIHTREWERRGHLGLEQVYDPPWYTKKEKNWPHSSPRLVLQIRRLSN